MPATGSAARGRALLAERLARAAEFVARVPRELEVLRMRPSRLPRQLVTTGIGTSEGHARHLAEAAARWLGQPARFAPTGTLAVGPPPDAEHDWLVVFSQGLSANARHALVDVESWGGVILVTGIGAASGGAGAVDPEKLAWLADLEARGVVRVEMGCGPEYGSLLRVIGARTGYAIGWSLLRTLAARRLARVAALEIDPEHLHRVQTQALDVAAGLFDGDEACRDFFAAERRLLLVTEDGARPLVEQLSLKLAEGLLRPQPRVVDVLEYAHGPLQGLAGRPTSILYLRAEAQGGASSPWHARFERALDPRTDALRVLRAQSPWPFAILEFEAMLDATILRTIEGTGTDLVDWPGADRERVLYEAGPERRSVPPPRPVVTERAYEETAWPEIEDAIARGRRTALVALGSIEQHGPHLPLGTDHWIAEALVRGLAARVGDAVALPPIALGCASEHLDFAGTLHVEAATLEAVLRDVLRSTARHGFERAFVFTAHGGNLDALEAMRERLGQAVRPLHLRIETDLRVGAMQAGSVARETLVEESAGPHAGEYETSLVAWLRPGSVRSASLGPGRLVARGEGQGLFYPSLRPNSESGVLGDPSRADASRGARYLAAWLDLLEEAYHAAFPAAG
ncbi:MAG: creatininase family protein [Spirochaetaceae bacterium]|nr:creatininase family protein [Myxococcales bacterium]MCB9724638.1 creatininase family protein [Spirochaetaceae bacterium]HPG24265.1 creatininase family protein [Myxococcota bacterium]